MNELKATGEMFCILDFAEDRTVEASSSIQQLYKTRPNLQGKWTCVATFGLDEFLKAMNIGWIQRTAASKAPWPTWVFMQNDDHVAFINQSAMGDLREDIIVDGPPYAIT